MHAAVLISLLCISLFGFKYNNYILYKVKYIKEQENCTRSTFTSPKCKSALKHICEHCVKR